VREVWRKVPPCRSIARTWRWLNGIIQSFSNGFYTAWLIALSVIGAAVIAFAVVVAATSIGMKCKGCFRARLKGLR
jgi:hypothetical protein